VTSWYSDPAPVADFENRIAHVLEHSNVLIEGAPKWKDLSEYIFSFNIQNEGQGHLDGNVAPVPEWWCERAKFMRGIMGDSGVLVATGELCSGPMLSVQRRLTPDATGGSNEFSNSDIPENWACETLDLVDIHSYSGVEEFRTKGPLALQRGKAADKLMLFEEYGASGENKAKVLADHISLFNGLGVPWMPWQISKPGNGASDFEFWTDEAAYNVVKRGARQAGREKSAQDWSFEKCDEWTR
jgi:mannan endo-1,4-beta-mannosidase